MRIQVNSLCYKDMKVESLIEERNFQIVGFYEDTSIFSKCLGMLQPVYLIEGKYYVSHLLKYPLGDVIKNIESTYRDLGSAVQYIDKYLGELANFIREDEFFVKEYGLEEKKVNAFFYIQEFDSENVIKQEYIYLNKDEYIGTIKLPNGKIVIGSEEFLEKTILEYSMEVEERYKLFEIDIKDVRNLIPFVDGKVLMADDFKLSDSYYNGAVVLPDGRIAVGDEGFLEKVILDNVEDKKRRYELLDDIYYNYFDFEKRENVINDFYADFYNAVEGFERKEWDDKRMHNYLMFYAFSLLGPLNGDFKEINDTKSIEDKKVLK